MLKEVEEDVDVETLQERGHVCKGEEEVDQWRKEQHSEIDTYQHLDKDKIEKGVLIE